MQNIIIKAIIKFQLLLLILLMIINYVAESYDYCYGIKTCSDLAHTVCKHPSPKPSHLCGNPSFIKSRCSREEQFEIVKAHNNLRAFVASGREMRGRNGPQPRARNIGPLSWDPELATIAQKWADQCKFGHDQCRDVARFRVSQNIGFKSHSAVFPNNYTDIVMQWYDEVKDFDNRLISNFGFTRSFILHYTTMIWAKTNKIGCGCIKYKKDNFWLTMHLVCNYGPAGNMIGEKVYET